MDASDIFVTDNNACENLVDSEINALFSLEYTGQQECENLNSVFDESCPKLDSFESTSTGLNCEIG